MSILETLLEAEKRGIEIPQDKQELLAEARKRGIVPPKPSSDTPPLITMEQAQAAAGKDPTAWVDQSMAGVNTGIANMVGFVPNAVTSAINQGGKWAGADDPLISNPVGGSQWLKDGPLAPTITDKQPKNVGERFVRRVGEELGESVVAAPFAMASKAVRAAPAAFAAAEGMSSLGSGSAAALAEEVAPNSALAQILAQILGGVGGAKLGDTLVDTGKRNPTVRSGIDEQKILADDAYGNVRADQRVLPQESVQELSDRLTARMGQERINPKLQPGASNVLEYIQDGAVMPNRIEDVENMRRVTESSMPMSASDADKRLGTIMKDDITKYLDDLDDPVADELRKGRDAHRRGKAAQEIEIARSNAALSTAGKGSGGNAINDARRSIGNLTKNKRIKRSFTKPELDAMRKVAMGTEPQNLMRRLSRFAPSSGGLSAMLGIGGVASMPEVGLPITAITEIAKKLGESSTAASIQNLLEGIAPSRILDAGSNGMTPALQALLSGRVAAGNKGDDETSERVLLNLLREQLSQ